MRVRYILLSNTNNLNQPFKAWPCMEVQQKNNLKYWNLQVGSSVQNIWWQEELHMVCKGFYAICIFHNSLFVGVNSHFREKHHKISLICYLIWSFYYLLSAIGYRRRLYDSTTLRLYGLRLYGSLNWQSKEVVRGRLEVVRGRKEVVKKSY